MKRHNILLETSVVGDRGLVVDRDAGIIRNVKILGYKSHNNRYYPPSTMKEAVAQNLYEQVPVFANHLTNPDEHRRVEDRLGRIINVRYVEGAGLIGDFELLKSHPMSDRIFEAAERLADSFGFSHTAEGDVAKNKKTGIYEVTKLTKVLSVDLVAVPATVHSLAEGTSIMRKVKKEVVEGASPYESEKEMPDKMMKDEEEKEKDKKDDEKKEDSDRCWPGYSPVKGKEPYEKGSCAKEMDHDDEKKEMCDDDMKKEEMDDKHDDMKKEEMDDKKDDDKKDDDKKEEEKDDEKKKESVNPHTSKKLIVEFCTAANIKADDDLIEDLSLMGKDLAVKTIRRLAEAKLETVKTYGPKSPEKKETNIKDIANWLLN